MPEIAKAYVQIVPSAEGISADLENLLGGDSGNAGKSAGALFTEGFSTGIGGITSIASTVISGMIDSIGAVGSQIASSITDFAKLGDSIDKMSQKMGISAEAYQEWDFIAQHSGTSMESLKGSFKTLSNAAQSGKEEFEALGISLEDAASMSTEDLFGAVIEGLQGMEEGTERTAIASSLLGKGATELGALLNTSAEDTAEMKRQVHELGGVLSDEAVKDAAAYQDSLQNLNVSIDGLKNGLISSLLPGITSVMDGLTKLVTGDESGLGAINSGINDFITNLTTGFADMVPVASQILLSIGNAIIENAPMLIESAGVIIMQLANGIMEQLPKILETGLKILLKIIQGIIDNLPKLISTITTVVVEIAKELTNPNTLVNIVNAALELIIALTNGIIEAIPILLEAAPEIIDNLVTALLDMLPLIIDAGFTLLSAILDNLPQILKLVAEATIQIVNSLIAKLIEKAPDIASQGYDSFMKLLDKIPKFLEEMKKSVKDIVDKLIEFFKGRFEDIKTLGKDIVDSIWDGIKSSWGDLKTKFEGLADDLIGGIKGLFSNADYTDSVQSSIEGSLNVNTNTVNSNMLNRSLNAGPLAYDSTNGSLYNLLSQYLPVIAAGASEKLIVEPSREGIFNLVREQNTLYTESTNYNPMVSG